MADPPSQPGGTPRSVRQFRPSRARRVGDAVISVFIRAGLVPRTYLLTTTGRRSGRPLTNPVTIVEYGGKRWLVGAYGPVSWVRNVRAEPRVAVHRRRDRREYTVREVPAPEAGPVLKEYVRVAPATRPYFQATKDDPVADFTAEADRHPVFELIPV
jgi:deazaflavin-dependent oxidoreductase (nitroreductase family)